MEKRFGELTEWLRSSPGKRVRRNCPVGSSPMLSAKEAEPLKFQDFKGSFLFFVKRFTLLALLKNTDGQVQWKGGQ